MQQPGLRIVTPSLAPDDDGQAGSVGQYSADETAVSIALAIMVSYLAMKPYKVKSSRVAWSCPWFSIRQDDIETLEGKTAVYNVVQLPGAVWTVPVTATGEIVLIRNYRHTVNDWCYEVPAGAVKLGQSVETTARMELREEIGGVAANLEYIGNFYTMNGVGDEVAHVFLATGVTLGQPQHEPLEIIEICPTPISEALRMAQKNEISDGTSALALLLCAPRLKSLEQQL